MLMHTARDAPAMAGAVQEALMKPFPASSKGSVKPWGKWWQWHWNQTGWSTGAWQRASASAPELFCKPRAKRRPQQEAICSPPCKQPQERWQSKRWRTSTCTAEDQPQPSSKHGIATGCHSSEVEKIRWGWRSKDKGMEKQTSVICRRSLANVSTPRKKPRRRNAWKTNQQLWITSSKH